MTKNDFLEELKQALAGEVPANVMMDSYSYYANYIEDEMRNGKTEEDVLEELGKPSLIARSIIAAQAGERSADYEYTEDGRTRTVRNHDNRNANRQRDERDNNRESTTSRQISFNASGILARVVLVIFIILMVLLFYFVIKIGFWVLITFGIPILLALGIVYLIMYFSR